jgi:uncharacterized protein YlxW (UPF0749 family)
VVETVAPGAGRPPEQTTPLLELITLRSLDADYEHVAERRRAAGEDPSTRRVPRRTAGLVLLAFGLLVTVAAVQTSRDSSANEASRASLIQQIDDRRDAVADLQKSLSRLQSEQLAQQRTLTRAQAQAQAARARVARMGARTGFAAVSGPGVQATVTSAPGSDSDHQVRDSDLALLADAISVNGQRLTVLSSFRNVGVGILVNSQPISPPYVFSVLGDPDTLPANLLSSAAGARWYALADSLGFSFQVHNAPSLTLPAAAPPQLRSAEEVGAKDRDTRTQGDATP